ncbi:hypothetical protein HK102_000689, partial [Quaeritorhiza haematococci]
MQIAYENQSNVVMRYLVDEGVPPCPQLRTLLLACLEGQMDVICSVITHHNVDQVFDINTEPVRTILLEELSTTTSAAATIHQLFIVKRLEKFTLAHLAIQHMSIVDWLLAKMKDINTLGSIQPKHSMPANVSVADFPMLVCAWVTAHCTLLHGVIPQHQHFIRFLARSIEGANQTPITQQKRSITQITSVVSACPVKRLIAIHNTAASSASALADNTNIGSSSTESGSTPDPLGHLLYTSNIARSLFLNLLRDPSFLMSVTNNKGETPLHLLFATIPLAEQQSFIKNNFQIINFFITSAAAATGHMIYTSNAACSLFIKLLTNPSFQIDLQDAHGNTILHLAAKVLDIPVLKLLHQHHKPACTAVMSVTNNQGKTPLHLLCAAIPLPEQQSFIKNNFPIINFFITSLYLTLRCVDGQGRTPLAICDARDAVFFGDGLKELSMFTEMLWRRCWNLGKGVASEMCASSATTTASAATEASNESSLTSLSCSANLENGTGMEDVTPTTSTTPSSNSSSLSSSSLQAYRFDPAWTVFHCAAINGTCTSTSAVTPTTNETASVCWSLTPEQFIHFLQRSRQHGLDINALDGKGRTGLDILKARA